jgi:hypothetical protein
MKEFAMLASCHNHARLPSPSPDNRLHPKELFKAALLGVHIRTVNRLIPKIP